VIKKSMEQSFATLDAIDENEDVINFHLKTAVDEL